MTVLHILFVGLGAGALLLPGFWAPALCLAGGYLAGLAAGLTPVQLVVFPLLAVAGCLYRERKK